MFTHDVFLSYSSRDLSIVREIAERLCGRGLRVWFAPWELEPGDSIPSRIDEGLDASAVLVLCMSANAFGSEWSRLESMTFRHRDPPNRELRVIALRLDDAQPPGSLAQFLAIDWRERGEDEFERLARACRAGSGEPAASSDVAGIKRAHDFARTHRRDQRGRLSPPGTYALSASADRTVRRWNLATGTCQQILEGHTDTVRAVAYHPAGTHALSASADGTGRVWDLATATCQHADLWRDAADFKTSRGLQIGLRLTRRPGARADLDLYCDPLVAPAKQALFARYAYASSTRPPSASRSRTCAPTPSAPSPTRRACAISSARSSRSRPARTSSRARSAATASRWRSS